LPKFAEEVRFTDWKFVAEGTHARIFQARKMDEGALYCVKIFQKGWMTPFNLEKTAYEYLQAAGVKDCIPHVYGYSVRTLADWGLETTWEDTDEWYGLIMEWLEGGEQLSVNNITHNNACRLLLALAKIHAAGVLHYDTYRRNLMVFPGTRRVVWLDFSCAHMNEEYAHPGEVELAAGVIFEVVCPPHITSPDAFSLFEERNGRLRMK
jgi:predicted Ser/Thr protein kinase